MSEASCIETEVIAWLGEIGIKNADLTTRISSLNLAWIVHRFEESRSASFDIFDEDLERIVDVKNLISFLSTLIERK